MRNDDLRLAGFGEPRDSEPGRPMLSRQTESRSAKSRRPRVLRLLPITSHREVKTYWHLYGRN